MVVLYTDSRIICAKKNIYVKKIEAQNLETCFEAHLTKSTQKHH